MFVATPEAGGPGHSGSIKIDTGFSQKSDSGSIDIKTGAAHGASDYDTQDSGSITMQVGKSDEGNGGQVQISAGASYSSHSGKTWCIFLLSLSLYSHSALMFSDFSQPKAVAFHSQQEMPSMTTTTVINALK